MVLKSKHVFGCKVAVHTQVIM